MNSLGFGETVSLLQTTMCGRSTAGWSAPLSRAIRQSLNKRGRTKRSHCGIFCRYSLVARETARWYHEMVDGENWLKQNEFVIDSLDQSMLKVCPMAFRRGMFSDLHTQSLHWAFCRGHRSTTAIPGQTRPTTRARLLNER